MQPSTDVIDTGLAPAHGSAAPTGRPASTRDNILDAARRTFVRKGFHRATVDDITRLADVAHGTFYRYFRNKQDVLHALVTDAVGRMRLPDRDWDSTDVMAVVTADVAAFLKMVDETREIGRIWAEAASYDETCATARQTMRQPYVNHIRRLIETGIERGIVPPVDIDVAASALASMVDGFAHEWFVVQNRTDDHERLAHTIAQLWCRGLGFPCDTGRVAI